MLTALASQMMFDHRPEVPPKAESTNRDRRADPRFTTNIPGMVILSYCQQLPVTIVDLSAGGCQIRLAHPLEVPQRFDLQFRNLAYLCERRWVNGLSVGV
jgi:hypothetical protein